MYNGFKKFYKKKGDIYHLGSSNTLTLCGISSYKGDWETNNEAQDPPEDKRLCKNCRQSIFKIGKDD